jgi:putative two-component system response regulator
LVAEDDPIGRELLLALLDRLGYTAAAVGDAEAALAAVREDPPDLVLSDVGMPGMGGFELCRRIKADVGTRLIPVVLVTGIGEEYRRAGIEAGADEFLAKPVSLEELRLRLRALLRMKMFTDDLESAEAVLCTLAKSIEAKDPYTEGHCERLARSAVALGEAMGLATPDLRALHLGGYLHDLGKIGIPEAILLKPGPLSDGERAIMKRHPIIGEAICRPLRTLSRVLPIIRHHHERLDGTGYPDGLAGEAVPVLARVLQVVDLYDALTTERPYRKAMAPEAALALMQQEAERGWWDSAMVDRFRAMAPAPPPHVDREDSHVRA